MLAGPEAFTLFLIIALATIACVLSEVLKPRGEDDE